MVHGAGAERASASAPPAADGSAEPGARPRDRRAQLVAVAARLFAERGYSGVGIDDIGAAAGVSGPAIYRHFKGKQALLAAIMVGTFDVFLEGLPADATAEGGARLVRESVAVALDHGAELAVTLQAGGHLRPEDQAAVLERRAALLRRWGSAMRGARPRLDDLAVEVRQLAVIGGLAAVATRRQPLARPHLDHVLAAAAQAVLAAPTPRRRATRAPRPATWQPPTGRREELQATALRLFRERGFHGVGIDEIGEAVGITGPAVYRHIRGKVDLLVDAYDRAGARVTVGAEEALAGAADPLDALERLARSYVEVAVDSQDLIAVTTREGGNLPAEDRPRLARRRRENLDRWVATITAAEPATTEAEALVLARTAIAMANNAALLERDPAELVDELVPLLVAAARSVGRERTTERS